MAARTDSLQHSPPHVELAHSTLPSLPSDSYYRASTCSHWKVLWEAGPYYEQIADALEHAKSFAVFVGWQIDSRIELTRSRHESFRDMVVRLCQSKPDFHVYFLMWDHAYFYVFEREFMQELVWSKVHERVHFVFDNRHPYCGCHHEKIVIIDDERAFVSGLDICDERWDLPTHKYYESSRSLSHNTENHKPYHDLTVEVQGQVVPELLSHVRSRWETVSSIPFPRSQKVNVAQFSSDVLISRTRVAGSLRHPFVIRETELLFREIIKRTQHRLVIENQFYWSPTIHRELLLLMERRARHGLEIVLVLPSYHGAALPCRMMGHYQTKLIDELIQRAARTGTQLTLGCPFVRGFQGLPDRRIYVHSKLMVSDDRYLVIGSSNFNNRGLRMDTEINLTFLGSTPETQRQIAEVAHHSITHWKQEGVILKTYHDAWDPYFTTWESRLARLLPVRRMFDPALPVGHRIWKQLLRNDAPGVLQSAPLFFRPAAAFTAGVSVIAALVLSLVTPMPLSSLLLFMGYVVVFALSWLLPLPTVLVGVCAGLSLNLSQAGLAAWCGIMIAGAVSYIFGRLLPNASSRFQQPDVPQWLRSLVGLRTLRALVSVMVNPRLSVKAKFAYQGVYSVPIRWFSLGAFLLALIHAGITTGVAWLKLTMPLDETVLSILLILAISLLTGYRLRHSNTR